MRKSALIYALALIAGCKSGEIVDPSLTTNVVVSSTPTQIAVGETAQASAIVKDQNGNALSGKTISWSSLNQSIATVDGNGLIRGVAPGTATIRGSVDGITGSATVQVVAPVPVCSNGPTSISLAVGEVRVLNVLETSGCVKVAAVDGQPQYVVIAANAGALPDQVASLLLRSSLGETVPAGNLLASPDRIAASLSQASVESKRDLQGEFEKGLREFERGLKLRRAQLDFAESRGLHPSYSVSAAVVPSVGDKKTFRVPSRTESCSQFKTINATARFISTRAIIYTDDASPPNGFTSNDFVTIATEFDNLIYPTGTEYFGTPQDLDENSRIIILYTPEVNKLTQSGNPDSFVGGFFFAGDLFPTSDCAQSNRAELFYALAPDPEGSINGNKRTAADVRQGTRGTIAHEFQHMINASERIRNPQTIDLESVWLDEALAHFAEDLNGRRLRSLNETGNYTFEQLTSNGGQSDFNSFFYQNFARLGIYLANTAPNSPTSENVDESLADRGAAWSLLRYAADHYAPSGDVKSFIKSLVPGPDTGVVNLRTKAGNVVFDSLVAGWMVTNFADDAGIPGVNAKYTYRTYNMRSNVSRVNSPSQSFPLVPAVISSATSSNSLQVRSASGAYFRFTQPAGGPARIFRFTNVDGTTAATFSGATLIIMRTQ